jgi:hypothetical protein
MSTTYLAVKGIYPNPQCSCKRNISSRCASGYGLPAPKYRAVPNITKGVGPAHNGLKNPGCQDCLGCHSEFYECPASCNTWHVSYFSIEFARDVEFQTDTTSTSQETYVRYMAGQSKLRQNKQKAICVLGSGVHDKGLYTLSNITDSAYVTNVMWYLGLLQQHCEHFIWIKMTSVRWETEIDRTMPQRNSDMQRWNDLIVTHITAEMGGTATVIDGWEASKRCARRVDGRPAAPNGAPSRHGWLREPNVSWVCYGRSVLGSGFVGH